MRKITREGIILLAFYAFVSLFPAGLTLALLRFARWPWSWVIVGTALAFGACILVLCIVATGSASERGRR